MDFALHYARQGYRVFPLAEGAKVPAIPRDRGGHGCLDATTTIEVIERWWAQYPQANVGIATGRGLLVIDVDPRKAAKWLESLQALEIPPTFTVKTWSGGWHLYLSMPPTCMVTIGTDLLPGIDWRGNGGYVVAAGSMVQEKLYTIARNVPIAQAPKSLLERLSSRSQKPRPERDTDGNYVIRAGQRNEVFFALACLLRRFGCNYNVIVQSLSAANSEQAERPLEDREVRQIAASAMRYAPRKERA